MLTHPPPFASLLRAWNVATPALLLTAAVRLRAPGERTEAARLLRYLSDLGEQPRDLDELLAAINGFEDEEELSAHRVAEGVAVTHASDGWWLLFVD